MENTVIYYAALFLLIATVNSMDFHPKNSSNERPRKAHYIITVPNILQPGQNENIIITLIGTTGATLVSTILKGPYGEKMISKESSMIRWYHRGIPFKAKIQVPKNVDEGYAMLNIKCSGGININKEKLVLIKAKDSRLFLKTNKYIYEPGETVKLWGFALSQDLLPYGGMIEEITLKDYYGYVVDRKTNVPSKQGVVSLSLNTSNYQEGPLIIESVLKGKKYKVGIYVGNNRLGNIIGSSKRFSFPRNTLQSRNVKQMERNNDEMFSPSGSYINIIKPKRLLKVHQKEAFTIVYNNPTDGINIFFYQITCTGNVIYSNHHKDIYFTSTCGKESSTFDVVNAIQQGPNKEVLCRQNSTKFNLRILITQKMVPSCRLIVYRVIEMEVIAKDVLFNTEERLRNSVLLTVSRNEFNFGDPINITITGKANTRVLLIGSRPAANTIFKRDVDDGSSSGTLTKKNIFNFLRSRSSEENIVTMFIRCQGLNYIVASQAFRNAGISAVSDLQIDPQGPCFGYGWPRMKYWAKRERYKRQSSPEVDLSSRYIDTWVWEDISFGELTTRYTRTLTTPNKAGIWFLQAYVMSEVNGLGISEKLQIKIKEKITTPSPLVFRQVQQRWDQTDYDLTVKILPDMTKSFFMFEKCQPLQLQVCVSKHIRNTESPVYIQMDINMVEGFEVVKSDIYKLYMSRTSDMVSFIFIPGSLRIFIIQRDNYHCFSFGLNENGKYNPRNNKASITIYDHLNPDEKFTNLYEITDVNCAKVSWSQQWN